MEFKKIKSVSEKNNLVVLISKDKELNDIGLSAELLKHVKAQIKNKETFIHLNDLKRHIIIAVLENDKEAYKNLNNARAIGAKIVGKANAKKIKEFSLITPLDTNIVAALVEGIGLSNYQFLKYKTEKKKNTLEKVSVVSSITTKQLTEIVHVIEATNQAKDLVNEPVSFLNAVQITKEIKRLGKDAGFKVEVFNKAKIESLKMGGLLAVNKGSVVPPTFSILEWKPEKAKNKKPIVLVGKGVVYDTGGLSLKPTPNSMDIMKCDMGGAAAVIGAIYAVAKNKLPIHVIALVPATDNRPGGDAYAPGDVITMHNKKTVEVLNTDAEGRMILADALSYAQKYNPELVIDSATLTGAAAAAIGYYGVVAMGNASEKTMQKLKNSGNNVYERIVEFPFWEEYEKLIESDIADIKNLGGPHGGAITAGKFLEHFTDYPYIHTDIAGPAWMKSKVDYISKGGSGVGVRLFYDFIKNY